jgi:hypothetical protein
MHGATSVLVSQRGVRIAPPIFVVYDGTPPARRALEIGVAFAGEGQGHLCVGIVAAEADTAVQLRRQVARLVGKKAPFARYRRLSDAKGKTVLTSARAESCGTLLIGADTPPPEDLRPLLDEIARPVLLIR